jgi:hypothetical protein
MTIGINNNAGSIINQDDMLGRIGRTGFAVVPGRRAGASIGGGPDRREPLRQRSRNFQRSPNL